MRTSFLAAFAVVAIACGGDASSSSDALGMPSAHRFDPGGLNCPSTGTCDGTTSDNCFCPAEQAIFDGTPSHFVYVGSKAGADVVSSQGNTPVATINTLSDFYVNRSDPNFSPCDAGDTKIDCKLWAFLEAQFGGAANVPRWVLLNEISNDLGWKVDNTYRTWLIGLATALHARPLQVVIASQYRGYDEVGPNWFERAAAIPYGPQMKQLSNVAFIAIESYVDIRPFTWRAQADRNAWVRGRYERSLAAYTNEGIPASKLILAEDYGSTDEAVATFGQQSRSDGAFMDFIDRTTTERIAVASSGGAFGTLSYAWGHNHLGKSAATIRAYMTQYVKSAGGTPGTVVASSGGGGGGGNNNGGGGGGGGTTPLPAGPTQCGALLPNQGLAPNTTVTSCDGRFYLVMQGDGNLVMYGFGRALWQSATNGSDGYVALMQADGNLVLYGHSSNPIWASNTSGYPGAYLALQNDSNLVVYAGSSPIWNSGGHIQLMPPPASGCTVMPSGTGIVAGQTFSSCGGHYHLEMQSDGNLVAYHDNTPIWASNTSGTAGYAAIMQQDGNFVLYGLHGEPLWATNTSMYPGATLQMQDDGNLVLYAGSSAVWASHTSGK